MLDNELLELDRLLFTVAARIESRAVREDMLMLRHILRTMLPQDTTGPATLPQRMHLAV